jgi:hypothetical protein
MIAILEKEVMAHEVWGQLKLLPQERFPQPQ